MENYKNLCELKVFYWIKSTG